MNSIPIRHLNTGQKEPDADGLFTIRNIHDMLSGKDMVQELHRHDFFYILALEKGAGRHEIDFSAYTISNGSIFFMRPGQVHQLLLKSGSTGYLIEFREEFFLPSNQLLNQLLRKIGHTSHYTPDAGRFQKLHRILTYIFQEYADQQERYQEVIKANIDIFFIELARQYPESSAGHGNLYVQERLEEFLALLGKQVNSQKEVSQYAAMLNLSVYQLNAITKAALNKTCSEIIKEHRVLEAKRYVLATANQISQIAYYLGYEDVSYFIRFFKKHTGYSPEAFRSKFLKKK